MKCNSTKCRAVHAGTNNMNFCLKLGPHHLEMTEQERNLLLLICHRGQNGKRASPRQHFPTRNGQTWVPRPCSGAVTSRRTSQHPCWRTRNEGEGSEGATWPERKGLAGVIGKICSQGRQGERREQIGRRNNAAYAKGPTQNKGKRNVLVVESV